MIKPVRQAFNRAMGPSAGMNNLVGVNPLHAIIGAAVMHHITKKAAQGSPGHQQLLGRIMSLHKLGMLGQSGQLYRAMPGQPMRGGVSASAGPLPAPKSVY